MGEGKHLQQKQVTIKSMLVSPYHPYRSTKMMRSQGDSSPISSASSTSSSSSTNGVNHQQQQQHHHHQLRLLLRISAMSLLILSNMAVLLLYFWTTENSLLMTLQIQSIPNSNNCIGCMEPKLLVSNMPMPSSTSSTGRQSYIRSPAAPPSGITISSTRTNNARDQQLIMQWHSSLSQQIKLVMTNHTQSINLLTKTGGLVGLAHEIWWKSWDLCYKLGTTTTTSSTTAASTTTSDSNSTSSSLLSTTPPPIVLNISFQCHDAFTNIEYGTGNFVLIFQVIHLIAASAKNVDVLFTCTDAIQTRDKLILPWMMGWYPYFSSSSGSITRSNLDAALDSSIQNQESNISATQVPDCSKLEVGRRWQHIQFDMRRMAIAMVGIPSPNHPSAQWAEQYLWSPKSTSTVLPTSTTLTNTSTSNIHPWNTILQIPNPTRFDTPLYPNTELDEAVIHFRCGDIIDSNLTYYGFIKFGSFSRYLDLNVQSIGIVTQPFVQNAYSREQDFIGTTRCRRVIAAFWKHLQERFPNARISIRNDPNEPITVAYARMVMAKQVIIAISSFGVFPAVSTFGEAFVSRPDYYKAPNQWLLKANISSNVKNLHFIDEPRLTAADCQLMWKRNNGIDVLKWMEDYSMPPLLGQSVFY